MKIILRGAQVYHSYLDEKHFFHWIEGIPNVKKLIGGRGGLEVGFEPGFNTENLRDVAAVLRRYDLNLDCLCPVAEALGCDMSDDEAEAIAPDAHPIPVEQASGPRAAQGQGSKGSGPPEPIIVIPAPRRYYSKMDEQRFFMWLKEAAKFKSVSRVEADLKLKVRKKFDISDLFELSSLMKRYDLDRECLRPWSEYLKYDIFGDSDDDTDDETEAPPSDT